MGIWGTPALLFCLLAPCWTAEWNYHPGGSHGPDNWADDAAQCAGDNQSPINIDTTTTEYEGFVPFDIDQHAGAPSASSNFLIGNSGHTVFVTTDGYAPLMSGGGLGADTYVFATFHLHWGKNSLAGSEHTINGNKYPAEVHFVHYNQKYGDLGSSLAHEDGLAVLGVMLEVGSTDNVEYAAFIDHFEDVKYKDDELAITSFAMRTLLPDDISSFFRYQGSLTTPPCSEAVTWTVFQEKVYMSEAQFAKLRLTFEESMDNNSTETNIEDNYRPTMPVNGRTIYNSVYTGDAVRMSASLTLMSTLLVAMATILYKH